MTVQNEIDESEVNTTFMRLSWVAHHDHMERLSLTKLDLSILYSLENDSAGKLSAEQLKFVNSDLSEKQIDHIEHNLNFLYYKKYVDRASIGSRYFYSIKEEFIPHIIAAFEG